MGGGGGAGWGRVLGAGLGWRRGSRRGGQGARVRVREFWAGLGSWGVASRVGLRKKGPGAFTAGMGPETAGGGRSWEGDTFGPSGDSAGAQPQAGQMLG